MPEVSTHPSAQALSLFSQGKLSEAQATTVASHLETCADCRKAVAGVPADSFLGKVRAARPSGTVPQAGPAPARPAAAPLANVPPELANHPKFRIIRELGRGGMGVIYLAEHRVLEKQVALKVISPAVLDNPDVLARFHAEARAAAKLDHQNIARAYDADQAGNLHFLVMEFVEGVTLAQLLEQKGPLPIASACRCVRQAALGLQHAFEQGMVHRDIKPQNLMLTPKGMVKVLDFGLARLRNERKAAPRLTQMQSFMGTPEYVAPEQATDAREADTRADIYSLGCTLYALLAGRPPFVEDTVVKMVLAHIEKEPLPLHELRPDVPPDLSAVVGKMLAKDPAQRYQRPIDVAQALVPFVKRDGKSGLAGAASLPPGVASAKTGTRIGGDTSRVTGPGQGESKRPDKAPAAGENEASPFSDLVDAPAATPTPKKAKKERKEAKPTPAAWSKRPAVLAGVAVAILALLLVVLWGAGVFKVKTADGTIVLEDLPPDAEVLVDGGTVTVTSADGKTFEVRVDPGKKHRLAVKKDGFKVFGEEVELDAGGRKSVLVRLEPAGGVAPAPKPGGPGKEQEKIDPKLRPAYKNTQGEWKIDGDDLVQESLFGECELVFGDFGWKDYDFSCEAKITKRDMRSGDVRLRYRVTGAGGNEFILGGWNNARDAVRVLEHGKLVERAARNNALEPDHSYKLAVQVRGTHGRCFVDGKQVLEYDDKRNPQGAVGFCANAVAVRFNNIRVTDPAGKVLFKGLPTLPATADEWLPATEPVSASELKCLKGHGAPVSDVTFSPDGRQIVSVSNGRIWGQNPRVINVGSASTLRLWDAETGRQLDSSPIGPSPWMADKLAWAPGSSRFVTAFVEDVGSLRVRLWSIEDGTLKSQFLFPENYGGFIKLSFTPDASKVLALATLWDGAQFHEGTIMEWDMKGQRRERLLWGTLKLATERCEAIAPNGRLALQARKDQPFTEIDLSTGKETGRWKQAANGVMRSLAFSPDSTRVLTGGNDGSVRLWDVAKGEQLCLVGTHELPVLAVAFSPDGKRALSGSEDQTVRLWDLEGNKKLACFTGHTGAIQAVAFSPDGRRAASGSADYTVRLWRLPPPHETPAKAKEDADGFVPLFNGKDLTGWEILNAPDKASWTVEKGILCAESKNPPCWPCLCTNQPHYGDFHLRAETMLTDGEPGALQVCAKFKGSSYKINISDPNQEQGLSTPRTGSLFRGHPGVAGPTPELQRAEDASIKRGEWFLLEVLVTGNRVRVLAKGKLVVDYTDHQKQATHGGNIMISMGPDTKRMQFRKIEIKELPPAGKPSDQGFVPHFSEKELTEWMVDPDKKSGRSTKGIELRDGVIVLDKPDSLLLSKRGDYKNVTFTAEVAASKGTEAFVGVRLKHQPEGTPRAGEWLGMTSWISDSGSKILAGMQWSNYERNGEHGMSRPPSDYDRFFTIRMSITGDEMWVSVNGVNTSGVRYNGDRFHTLDGCVGIKLVKGSIRIRNLDVQVLK